MGGKPLKIDWSQILPDKEAAAPSLELEVVPTPPIPFSNPVLESSSLPIEQQLTDRELEDKIHRLVKHLESGFANSLPDKGQKLQANLWACQRELDRRKLAPIHMFCQAAEKCETPTESKATDPSVSPSPSLHAIVISECSSQSSVFSLFNQTLDKRALCLEARFQLPIHARFMKE